MYNLISVISKFWQGKRVLKQNLVILKDKMKMTELFYMVFHW